MTRAEAIEILREMGAEREREIAALASAVEDMEILAALDKPAPTCETCGGGGYVAYDDIKRPDPHDPADHRRCPTCTPTKPTLAECEAAIDVACSLYMAFGVGRDDQKIPMQEARAKVLDLCRRLGAV